MRSRTIREKLLALDVPLDKAAQAAEQYGDDSGVLTDVEKVQRVILRSARQKAAELERRSFRVLCKGVGLPMPETEYHFAEHLPKPRHYRFDYAWPSVDQSGGVALEKNGGIWRKGGGAHTGTGHIRDMRKLNLAQELRWHVIQVTPEKLFATETLELIRTALAQMAA